MKIIDNQYHIGSMTVDRTEVNIDHSFNPYKPCFHPYQVNVFISNFKGV